MLAVRLNDLVRLHASKYGQLTNDQLARELKDRNPDLRVSGAYLSALRTGKRSRPSTELQLALARYFQVPLEQLLSIPEAAELTSERLADLGVRSIALRAVGLDHEGLSTVAAVLDHVRRLQGLPPIADAPSSGTQI